MSNNIRKKEDLKMGNWQLIFILLTILLTVSMICNTIKECAKEKTKRELKIRFVNESDEHYD